MLPPSYEDLQRQIADRQRELERHRQAAQEDERKRVEAEQAPRRAIANIETELRQLEHQAADVRWQQFANDQAALLMDQRTRAGEMFEALERADFMAARTLMKEVIVLGQRSMQYRNDAINLMERWRKQAYAEAWDRNIHPQRDLFELSRLADVAPEVRGFDRYKLPEPPHPHQFVLDWVMAVPEGLDRQIRRGLCFAAFGLLGDLHPILTRFGVPVYQVA